MVTRKKLILGIGVLILGLLGMVLPVIGEDGGTTDLQDLINKADRAARDARMDKKVEDRLRDAIDIYEKALEIDPDNRHVLNRLSVGYFTLAETYFEKGASKEAYRTGYHYGLRSLKVNEDFSELYDRIGFKALKKLPKSVTNVETLFWTGANLGRLDETKGVLGSLNDLPALVSLNRRVLEVDETYLGGGAHRALGSIAGELMSRLPFSFLQVQNNGFTWKKARTHFEQAIEIAPNCLENYFSYAKYYAHKRGKTEMTIRLLDRVKSEPAGDEFSLINRIAKEKASRLREKVSN